MHKSGQSTMFVTQPYLPPLEEFIPYLESIWESKILTNNGPYHQLLEKELASYLGVSYVSLFSNGTIALVTALQALRITGEVITTPYSFVATSHSLLWNGIKPVFVDIDRKSMNIDPTKIEAAITPETTAILPVHCYGTACDVNAIQKIADNYNLRVIYDAAHAFGVCDAGGSIVRHGDLSVLSFHATKVFNTFEGGAIISPDEKTKRRIDQLKNFGFVDEVTVVAPGINGKMNEISAAFGLLQLQHIGIAIAARQKVDEAYRDSLKNIAGIQCMDRRQNRENYSYFPILITPKYAESRDEVYSRMKAQGVHARRYFYPLISDFPMYRGLPSSASERLTVAHEVSSRILCLPIYPSMTSHDVHRVVELLNLH